MLDPYPDHRLKLESIKRAVNLIDPVFLGSPQYVCEPLSDILDCTLTLKLEFANPIRCFKGRGASLLVKQMISRAPEGSSPVIAASAGNWGQAIAYACRQEGIPAIVYAASNANSLKIDRMKALGAEVRLHGNDFDAAKFEAEAVANAGGGRFVADGLDIEASVGAATIAVELLQQQTQYDQVVIPLGGGAMLTGMARWIKAISPKTKVIGVCSRGADAMERSWRSKTIVQNDSVNTIADGIAVRVPIPEAIDDMEGIVDDVLLVTDDEIKDAMSKIYAYSGHIVEPAGSVGVAAILSCSAEFANKRVATVLSGSNIIHDQVNDWIFNE